MRAAAIEKRRVLSAGQNIIRFSRHTQQSIKIYAAGLDCAVTFAASLLGQICYGFIISSPGQDFAVAAGVGALASLIYFLLAQANGHYVLSVLTQPLRHVRQTWVLVLTVGLLLTAILFLLKTGASFSRGALILFVGLQLVGLTTARIVQGASLRRLLVKGDISGLPVVVIGDTEELGSLSASTLLMQFGFKEVARIGFSRGSAEDECDLRHAIELARAYDAAGFCLALDWGDQPRLAAISTALRTSPLAAKLVPDRRIRSVLGRRMKGSVGQNLVIEVQRAPLTRAERAAKRVFDFVFASIVLVAISPLMVAVVCAIKFDSPGPVIFRQRRKGFDQRSFLIYKFRSMTVMEDGDVIRQASRSDDRITRIGRLLRRTSIDELPQLLNVLRGEMSLVGPRPHALAHDDLYSEAIDTYCLRHHVKPGITGWAQVKGCRGETQKLEQMRARVEHDIWYVNNWSLLLDLSILMRTCTSVLMHEAY